MTSDIVEQLRAWAEPISSGYEVPRAAVTLYEAADEIESLRSRLADAEREARVLVVAMADKCGAPDNWKPLPDAAGMITQISNMVAGLREERALIVTRAENAEAALVEAEAKIAELRDALGCEMDDTRNACAAVNAEIDRVNKRLAEAEALLRDVREDYARAMNEAQIAADVGCNLTELGVKMSMWINKIARIDAHLAREVKP